MEEHLQQVIFTIKQTDNLLSLKAQQSDMTTLLNKIDYEIREIHAMKSDYAVGKEAEFPPGIFQLYSKTKYLDKKSWDAFWNEDPISSKIISKILFLFRKNKYWF